MLPLSRAQSDLSTRIDQWTREVAKHTRFYNKAKTLGLAGSNHGMNLRSSVPRQGLAEVSSNPRLRKRKADKTMPDSKGRAANTGRKKVKIPDVAEGGTGTGRGRGRPPKRQPVQNTPMTLRSRLSSSVSVLPLPTHPTFQPPSVPRSRSTSPRKAPIDMAYLHDCNPGVRLRTYRQIRMDGEASLIPESVCLLHERLAKVPKNTIPSELKVGQRHLMSKCH